MAGGTTPGGSTYGGGTSGASNVGGERTFSGSNQPESTSEASQPGFRMVGSEEPAPEEDE